MYTNCYGLLPVVTVYFKKTSSFLTNLQQNILRLSISCSNQFTNKNTLKTLELYFFIQLSHHRLMKFCKFPPNTFSAWKWITARRETSTLLLIPFSNNSYMKYATVNKNKSFSLIHNVFTFKAQQVQKFTKKPNFNIFHCQWSNFDTLNLPIRSFAISTLFSLYFLQHNSIDPTVQVYRLGKLTICPSTISSFPLSSSMLPLGNLSSPSSLSPSFSSGGCNTLSIFGGILFRDPLCGFFCY